MFTPPLLENVFARLAALLSGRLVGPALILAASAAMLLPGLATLPVTDRDEARYVMASRQMLETGDFIDIRNQEDARWKKPVGIYWLQSGTAALAGGAERAPIAAYRVPSALGAAGAALLTLWAFTPLAGRRTAALAALLLVTASLVAIEGHLAKTDAVLLATIVAAQGAFLRLTDPDRPASRRFSWLHALFWGAMAAGTLVKGPIILLAVVPVVLWFAIAGLSADPLRRLAPLRGLGLYLALVLPWFIAIGIKTDGAFFAESIGRDLLGKVGTGQESHGAPPGYYLATVWFTFWPWAPFALLALPALWAARRSRTAIYVAGAVIPIWVVFALSATKLPHYILPAFPALALTAAFGLVSERQTGRVLAWAAALLLALPGLVLAGLTGALVPVSEGRMPPLPALVGLLGAALALVAAGLLFQRRPQAAVIPSLAAALILIPTALSRTLPQLESVFVSPKMAALHDALNACRDHPLVSVGYHEPSLVVAAGTDTVLSNTEGAGRQLAGTEGLRVFVLDPDGERLERMAAEAGTDLAELVRFGIFHYSKGRPGEIALVARSDDPLLASCLPLEE